MKVTIKGKGDILLGKGDFVASGGFGDVYAKAGVAYKIYQEVGNMIPIQKIDELSVLTDPNIIRPMDVLLDARLRPIGYTMRYLKDTYTLCQLFPKGFRDRTGLQPHQTLALVRQLQQQVHHCHSKGITIVDLNELNELVSHDFTELYTIDVDNFKTRSFPAQGLMDSVKDHHAPADPHHPTAKIYDAKSDWFSFAVVSFNLFFGIHPYKGKHPRYSDMMSRMIHNVTIRDPEVAYPKGSILPFDVAPEVYLRWLDAVLGRGERVAPPDDLNAQIVLVTKLPPVSGSSSLEVSLLTTYTEDIIAFYYSNAYPVTITTQSLYLDKTKVTDVYPGTVLVYTPKMDRPVAARIDRGQLKLLNVVAKLPIPVNLAVAQMSICDGRIVALSSGCYVEIEFLEMSAHLVATPKLVGSAVETATKFYDGVAIQNLLGLWVADIFPGPGLHYQPRLKELVGWKVLEARYRGHVLQVVAINIKTSKYSRFVYRFTDDFNAQDVREVSDITPSGLNFIVRENGVVVQINEQAEIEVFTNQPGSRDTKTIVDPAISADMRLTMRGANIVFTRGPELQSIRMK